MCVIVSRGGPRSYRQSTGCCSRRAAASSDSAFYLCAGYDIYPCCAQERAAGLEAVDGLLTVAGGRITPSVADLMGALKVTTLCRELR